MTDAVKMVEEMIYGSVDENGIPADSLELSSDLLNSLITQLQSSQKYLDQGYVVADGPVDWTNFRFMGVRMLPISEPSTVT